VDRPQQGAIEVGHQHQIRLGWQGSGNLLLQSGTGGLNGFGNN
jgi:hypothetical protein